MNSYSSDITKKSMMDTAESILKDRDNSPKQVKENISENKKRCFKLFETILLSSTDKSSSGESITLNNENLSFTFKKEDFPFLNYKNVDIFDSLSSDSSYAEILKTPKRINNKKNHEIPVVKTITPSRRITRSVTRNSTEQTNDISEKKQALKNPKKITKRVVRFSLSSMKESFDTKKNNKMNTLDSHKEPAKIQRRVTRSMSRESSDQVCMISSLKLENRFQYLENDDMECHPVVESNIPSRRITRSVTRDSTEQTAKYAEKTENIKKPKKITKRVVRFSQSSIKESINIKKNSEINTLDNRVEPAKIQRRVTRSMSRESSDQVSSIKESRTNKSKAVPVQKPSTSDKMCKKNKRHSVDNLETTPDKKQKVTITSPVKNNDRSDIDILRINNDNLSHRVINIRGDDGNCLFRTLSQLMKGNQDYHSSIRDEIVKYVSQNWNDFQIETYNEKDHGNNFNNADEYVSLMSMSGIYGTSCELKAAGQIYPFRFQVYHSGKLIVTFGQEDQPIKRMRIVGNLESGHFEAYEPVQQSTCEEINIEPTSSPQQTHDTGPCQELNDYVPGDSNPPPLPENLILAPAEPAQTICLGSKHQGTEFYPESSNLSCVMMSITAICCKHANFSFDNNLIDIILDDGNCTYLNFVNYKPRLLDPEEFNDKYILHVNRQNFIVSTPSWVESGLYPTVLSNESLEDVVKRLHRVLNSHNNVDGFIFIGCNSAVSFWPKIKEDDNYTPQNDINNNIDCYYVFNSHAIDGTGEMSLNMEENKARLFKVNNLKSLAILLLFFGSNISHNNQYSVYAVKVALLQDLTISVSPSIASSVASSTASRRGRPPTKKRGRPKTKINAHYDAVKKYTEKNLRINRDAVKKYTEKKPEIHREAVKKYTDKNPEINREAVKKYTEKNPEINRDAVKKYTEKNPDMNLTTSQNYRMRNVDTVQQYYDNYNKNIRNVNPIIRDVMGSTTVVTNDRISNKIGELSGESLNSIPLFELKKKSLHDENILICQHCSAHLYIEEKTREQWCCGQGKNNIMTLPELTETFYNNAEFLKRIRAYNNAFAFSALGVSHGFQHPETGISFIKIQGRIYHRVFDLSYTDSSNPISRYIDDGHERKRLAQEQRLNENTINEITVFLERVNPFITHFRRLSLEEHDNAHLVFKKTNRVDDGNVLGDMPRGSEVAAIMSNSNDTYYPKSIAIWKIGNSRPHTVDLFHPLYETFQYPLLYPHGNAGWTVSTMNNNNNKINQVKYVRCLLLSCKRFSILGRLSEEWVVDMYCRIEEERLLFISNMQKRNLNSSTNLRVGPEDEILQNVARQVLNDETVDGDGGIIPGKIYLPNTFTGGPRYMKVKYMDAIAIVNRLGRPSYFLTMTCNPKWAEISENTPQHLNAPSVICARVFKIKLQKLLNDIKSGLWFGENVYIMHVIEFQKRGLPHAHIVFRVEGGGPVQNIEIDRIIRADIPPIDECDGRLRTLVLRHMVHGPCGKNHRTDLPCWNSEKKKCLKYFPKKANNTTYVDDRGFINLKRNPDNVATITYRNRNVNVSDLYIVPYNPALLLTYDCHINLEIASTRKIFKYLFKYITKGPDEARVAVVPDNVTNNEVESYVTARYIGSAEACWRVLEYEIQGREPTVKQLTVHLEGQHSVFFKPGEETEAVSRAKSDLIVYFNRPAADEFDNLTYQQFYEKYIIHSKKPTTKNVPIHEIMDGRYFVTKRQRNELVARLFWVAPNRGEQFYLRLLLASFPCRGYADLKSRGGPESTTFQEAARVLGIADDEHEYATALQEAHTFYTGRKLRNFFVLLITNGAPALTLWNQYKKELSEDFLERLANDEDLAEKQSLREIDRLLRRHGSSLENHGLPTVSDDSTEFSREIIQYDHGRLNSYCTEWIPRLSQEQRQVFDYICNIITNGSNDDANAVFLDGPSGTGKTLLLNCIVWKIRSLKKVAICTASSGIAALNYEGGCTAHSMFKFPFEILDDSGIWSLTNGTQRAELIYNSSLIIYDEAPMAHKYLIHLLDRSLKDLMQCTKPFGGKVIILAGDFRQIPPVVTNSTNNNDILNASFKTSPLYRTMKKFSLTSAQRTRSDDDYSEFLLNLGSGLLEPEVVPCDTGVVKLTKLSNVDFTTNIIDLIDFVFPEQDLNNPDDCARRAILSTHLINVQEINTMMLSKLDGDAVHCYSVDNVDAEQADQFYLGTDILNSVKAKGVPNYDLILKVGAIAIIIRNLSFSDRLVNGTKVIIVNISARLITIRKPGEAETFLIPRISFKFPIEPKSVIEMTRRQFPLQLAYAMTIHKSQGQTIDRVGIDLRSDVFSHGQLYVALGRVRSKENIKILIPAIRVINDEPYSNNVIIQELIN